MQPIRTTTLSLTLLALCAPLGAQASPLATPSPAPAALSSQFGATDATLQLLELPRTAGQSARFRVSIDGKIHDLGLEPLELRTPDFQLLVADGRSIRPLPRPESRIWKGTDGTGTSVTAAWIGRSFEATLHRGTDTWEIRSLETESLPGGLAHPCLVFPRPAHPAGVAQTTGTSRATLRTGPGAASSQNDAHILRIAELAFDCDYEAYLANRSDPVRATDRILAWLAETTETFRLDVGIEHRVTTVLVRTSPYYQTPRDLSASLRDFKAVWDAFHTNIRRDLALLVSGKRISSIFVSQSSIASVCTDNAYAVMDTTVFIPQYLAVAIALCWDAEFCNNQTGCRLMCRCSINGPLRFGSHNIPRVLAFRNTRTCLDTRTTQPVISSITPDRLLIYPPPAQIVLHGDDFVGADRVTIGGQPVPRFTITDNSEIRVQLPPIPSVGTLPVVVHNPAFSSPPVDLTIDPVDPPVHSAPTFAVRGQLLTMTLAGPPGDSYLLHATFNGRPTFPFLGFDILATSIPLDAGVLTGIGFREWQFNVPDISLAGLQMFSQLVTLDTTAGTLEHATTILQTNFLR